MRIIGYTSLYPAPWAPIHGIFVQELVRSMDALVQVDMVVPENGWRRLLTGSSKTITYTPPNNRVHRCRFWTIPKLFKKIDAHLMAHFSRGAFRAGLSGKPQLVHAHYAYPDACAAAILARRAGLPLVVTCHGSDINVLARDPKRKRHIINTLNQAAAVITVSSDLRDKISAMGVDPARVSTIPNGVDLSLFECGDKVRARKQLEFHETGPLLLAVGRLEHVKGYDRLLQAVARMQDVNLMLVGQGSLRQSLERLAIELGIKQRVRFAGEVLHNNLAPYFQSADALVISSHSEGWPTIIHEALACGTPVVAPAIGGIPEALADPDLGVLLATGEPDDLVQGIRQALNTCWNPSKLHGATAKHDWRSVARKHVQLYAHIITNLRTEINV